MHVASRFGNEIGMATSCFSLYHTLNTSTYQANGFFTCSKTYAFLELLFVNVTIFSINFGVASSLATPT